MSRYTVTDLRQDVALYNSFRAADTSTYFYRSQGRNGYQNIDLYHVNADGSVECQRHVEGGSSRECRDGMERDHNRTIAGYKYPDKKASRQQAYQMLRIAGQIDFNLDVCQLRHSELSMLHDWAKATGYRKPQHANGSLGRYFYQHLKRLAAKDKILAANKVYF